MAAHVVHQQQFACQVLAWHAHATSARCVVTGRGEGPLDRSAPRRRRVGGRSDQQQAERERGRPHRRAAQPQQRADRDCASDQQRGNEPVHVVLAVQQHDLRCDRADRGQRRQQPAPVAMAALREARERDGARARHRRRAGTERGDVIGMDDALGEAQQSRLDQEPAAEHDQGRERRVAPRRPGCGRAALGDDPKSQSQQAEQGEWQQPAALVSETSAEQAQWTGGTAEGDHFHRRRGQQRGLARS